MDANNKMFESYNQRRIIKENGIEKTIINSQRDSWGHILRKENWKI